MCSSKSVAQPPRPNEQVTQILAVACEPPEQSGHPVDRWTHRELADEVVRRGIVPFISASQVGRYLAQAELQPHRSKYWLNAKEKDPAVFEQQAKCWSVMWLAWKGLRRACWDRRGNRGS